MSGIPETGCTTLPLDPFHDVRLSEELALQEQYLEIEHERFSDRMNFHIDIPEDVRHALMPSLIPPAAD